MTNKYHSAIKNNTNQVNDPILPFEIWSIIIKYVSFNFFGILLQVSKKFTIDMFSNELIKKKLYSLDKNRKVNLFLEKMLKTSSFIWMRKMAYICDKTSLYNLDMGALICRNFMEALVERDYEIVKFTLAIYPFNFAVNLKWVVDILKQANNKILFDNLKESLNGTQNIVSITDWNNKYDGIAIPLVAIPFILQFYDQSLEILKMMKNFGNNDVHNFEIPSEIMTKSNVNYVYNKNYNDYDVELSIERIGDIDDLFKFLNSVDHANIFNEMKRHEPLFFSDYDIEMSDYRMCD